jgi:hypothetical protein
MAGTKCCGSFDGTQVTVFFRNSLEFSLLSSWLEAFPSSPSGYAMLQLT